MSGLKTYISQVLQDTNGSYSSKRAITILGAILMSIGFIANLFYGYKIDEFIFNAVMYVVIGGMGITGVEKFAPANASQDTTG